MSEIEEASAGAVARILAKTRVRYVAVRGAASLLVSTALCLGAVGMLAVGVGPFSSRGASTFAGVLVAFPLLVAIVVAIREALRLDHATTAGLYAAYEPTLASRVRSAVEISNVRTHGESASLAAAHLARTAAELASVRTERVVQTRAHLLRPAKACVAVVALALLVTAASPRMRSGVYALAHPASDREDTAALVVTRVRYHVSPPTYRKLPEFEAVDGTTVAIPEGSRVHVKLETTFDARSIELRAPSISAVLRRVSARRYEGELVASHGGRLEYVARMDGRTLVDAVSRAIVLIEDASPSIVFDLIGAETPVALDADVGFHLEARDDVGLAHVSRVIKLPSGIEARIPMEPGSVVPQFAQEGSIRVADLGLRPGDTIQVYAEATDADEVRGPKTTRSELRSITIASSSSDREGISVDLRAALDAALSALADRLERAIGTTDAERTARKTLVQSSTALVVDELRKATRGDRGRGISVPDASLVSSLERRITPLLTRESRLAPNDARTLGDVDARLVTSLEEGALVLADVLSHIELEDAAAIARELDSLRREMVSLVEALRRSDSPETRLRIAADIERARRRMSELGARLAKLGDEVPGEFRNAGAELDPTQTEDALRSLERAIAANDLDAADRALADLERHVSGLAKAFQENAGEMGESRFGPRERAFRDAMEVLAGIEAEQSTLAEETTRVRRDATERALEDARNEQGAATRALADRAKRLRDATAQLDRSAGTPVDHELSERAIARLDDVEEALRRGDVGSAQEMMERAQHELDATARDLEVTALMFPGRGGRTREAAQRARTSSETARELLGDVLRQMPRLSERLDENDVAHLENNANRQDAARSATQRLAERFGEEIDGAPLSEEASAELQSIGGSMENAESSIRSRDAITGADSQGEAARRLRALRESLERASSGGGGSGEGGQGEGGGDGQPMPNERVEIPGANASPEIAARRRRLLDAMGGDVPDAYRGAVHRYYEELLR